MDLGAAVGRVMAMLGVVCAVVAIFVLEGISIVFPAKSYGHLVAIPRMLYEPRHAKHRRMPNRPTTSHVALEVRDLIRLSLYHPGYISSAGGGENEE